MSTKSYHNMDINTSVPEVDPNANLIKITKRNSILLSIVVVLGTIMAITGIVYVATRPNTDHHVPNPTDPFAEGLENVADVKRNVVAYYESSKYHEHVESLTVPYTKKLEVALKAAQLAALVGAETGDAAAAVAAELPPAVVFDIDETLLNNYEATKNADFAYDKAAWAAWVLEARAPVIPGTQAFYNVLVDKKVKIIMITGRHEAEREATLTNLQKFGLAADELVLRTPAEDAVTAAVYKAAHRKTFSTKYNIIGCIGDQVSDCAGGYTGEILKLPNFMYFIA